MALCHYTGCYSGYCPGVNQGRHNGTSREAAIAAGAQRTADACRRIPSRRQCGAGLIVVLADRLEGRPGAALAAFPGLSLGALLHHVCAGRHAIRRRRLCPRAQSQRTGLRPVETKHLVGGTSRGPQAVGNKAQSALAHLHGRVYSPKRMHSHGRTNDRVRPLNIVDGPIDAAGDADEDRVAG